jgi:DNA polymerase-1
VGGSSGRGGNDMIISMAGEDYIVEYVQDPNIITKAIEQDAPQFFTFDTETDSILENKQPHIFRDRPFLGGVCFDQKVYIFSTNKSFFSQFPHWSSLVKRIYGHNITFDMHMMGNVMGKDFPLRIRNWGDTMGLCRLTFQSISSRDGGDKLGLKPVSKKYIDKNADKYEADVKNWLKQKKAQDNKLFTALAKPLGWSYSKMQDAIKKELEIPEEVLDLYAQWKQMYPRPTYKDVELEIMIPYLAVDVILTKILVMKCLPVVVYKQQISTMEREFKALRAVYRMECPGIAVDRDYLQECNAKLGAYIENLYAKLFQLAGVEFTVGQNAVIKKMYEEILGEEIESTNKKFLKKMESGGDEIAGIITKLRRLEKWKQTYIERILEVSKYDGRFYTQLNQFSPVSGRFSGDAQQFPKDAIYTAEGYAYEKETGKKPPADYVLFHPRKAFLGHIYYLDYSQVELRVQAHYTLYFGGDKNLCRAYMPYMCVHADTGRIYDYRTVSGRAEWSELREGSPDNIHWEEALEKGYSVWIDPDTGKPWVPTDVHSSTTEKALRIMGYDVDNMDPADFKWWRSKGKTFNFMRNYGGGDRMAAETLDITFEQAQAMNRGYTDAFPIVVVYQDEVVKGMREKGYCVNMLGRRYYVESWNKHYKVANYLIQGSCADYLKEKMIEIDEFLEANNCKTRMILCIHDELQFDGVPGEEWVIAKIKEMMEDTPAILVPIVAECEVTTTDWAAKKKLVNIA